MMRRRIVWSVEVELLIPAASVASVPASVTVGDTASVEPATEQQQPDLREARLLGLA
jgi:hypothetical protein